MSHKNKKWTENYLKRQLGGYQVFPSQVTNAISPAFSGSALESFPTGHTWKTSKEDIQGHPGQILEAPELDSLDAEEKQLLPEPFSDGCANCSVLPGDQHLVESWLCQTSSIWEFWRLLCSWETSVQQNFFFSVAFPRSVPCNNHLITIKWFNRTTSSRRKTKS